VKPSRKRELADELIERYRVGIRQACAALRLPRSVYYHRSSARDSTRLKARIGEIAATRVHYGYRRVHVLLRREGFQDNHKRVYRLYREQGLSLRHKRPKRNKAAKLRQPKTLAQRVNQMWSMDFSMVRPQTASSLDGMRRLAFIYPACRKDTQGASGLHEEAARSSPD